MSVTEAVEAGFVPAQDKDQADMLIQLKLRLYQHAQDHRLLTQEILGYPSLYGDILGKTVMSKVPSPTPMLYVVTEYDQYQPERLMLPAQRRSGPKNSDTSSTSPYLVHEACTRSISGCGSLGAGGLTFGACQCLRPREGTTLSTGQEPFEGESRDPPPQGGSQARR